ncbi:MAG: hypothetical protein V2G41_10170 [bacterium JZ-2024 1]
MAAVKLIERQPRQWIWGLLILIVTLSLGLGGLYWWKTREAALPGALGAKDKGVQRAQGDEARLLAPEAVPEIVEFEVPRGRTVNGFTFTREGILTYSGRRFSPNVAGFGGEERVAISFLRSRGLAGAILMDPDGQNRSFLLDVNTMSSTPSSDGWDAAQKIFWSPSRRYMVVFCSYEGERFIRVDLNTKQVLWGDFLGSGDKTWEIRNNPRWLGDSDVLVFNVEEYCDPYGFSDTCVDEPTPVIYEVHLDAATLKLSARRIRSRSEKEWKRL